MHIGSLNISPNDTRVGNTMSRNSPSNNHIKKLNTIGEIRLSIVSRYDSIDIHRFDDSSEMT